MVSLSRTLRLITCEDAPGFPRLENAPSQIGSRDKSREYTNTPLILEPIEARGVHRLGSSLVGENRKTEREGESEGILLT